MKKDELEVQNTQNYARLIEFRHFIRHPICLPLGFKILTPGSAGSEKDLQSETINVSMGGLLFPSKQLVKTGSRILIRMPFEGKMFKIKAKVIRCDKNTGTNLYDIAVSFPKSQEAFKVKMIEQIYRIAEFRDLLSLEEEADISLDEASREWIKRYSDHFRKLYW